MDLTTAFGRWGWIELAGALLVAIGCIGELVLIFRKETTDSDVIKRRHRLEKIFVSMVAIGVTVELFALPKNLYEAALINKQAEEAKLAAADANRAAGEANQKAAEANERASLSDSNNLVLKSNLVAFVKEQTEAREIDPSEFAKVLAKTHPMNVILINSLADRESSRFAELLNWAFEFARWRVIERYEVNEVRTGVFIQCKYLPPDPQAIESADFLMNELNSRGVATGTSSRQPWGEIHFETFPSNTVAVIVGAKPSRLENKLFIDRRKAWDTQTHHSAPDLVSNAWRNVFLDEEDMRQHYVDFGIIPTNTPHTVFSPKGFYGDGAPIP